MHLFTHMIICNDSTEDKESHAIEETFSSPKVCEHFGNTDCDSLDKGLNHCVQCGAGTWIQRYYCKFRLPTRPTFGMRTPVQAHFCEKNEFFVLEYIDELCSQRTRFSIRLAYDVRIFLETHLPLSLTSTPTTHTSYCVNKRLPATHARPYYNNTRVFAYRTPLRP